MTDTTCTLPPEHLSESAPARAEVGADTLRALEEIRERIGPATFPDLPQSEARHLCDVFARFVGSVREQGGADAS